VFKENLLKVKKQESVFGVRERSLRDLPSMWIKVQMGLNQHSLAINEKATFGTNPLLREHHPTVKHGGGSIIVW